MTYRARGVAVCLGLLLPCAASAQSWRTVESSRQLSDSTEHHVQVRYAAGRLDVTPTDAPVLYSMNLRYDEGSATPLHHYDASAHLLTLGIDAPKTRFARTVDEKSGGEMRLSLSRRVPIDLALDLGATQGALDLGGLNLLSLRLDSGASDMQLDFSTPNRSRMRAFEVQAGAASLEAKNLANANAPAIHVESGVGSVDLDFGGVWTQDLSVNAEVALGKLTLHIPQDIGVRVEVEKLLASFDQQGLEKRADAYYSSNWDRARYHLRLRAETAVGGIEIDRTEK